MKNISRSEFIQSTLAITAALMAGNLELLANPVKKILVGAHLWVYASQYPPTGIVRRSSTRYFQI